MENVYRINMKTEEIKKDEFDQSILLGNRGLVAKVLLEEVNPKCDALGPENKLILATGLFTGTGFTTAGRLSFGAKSPLTGTVKESNVGGTAGTELGKHGIKMLIVEDKPNEDMWYILRIDENSQLTLENAMDYIGKNTYETTEKLKEKYGVKTAVCVIGNAGERQLSSSSIQVTDNSTGHPGRAAGRGGLGAVMGSKGLKAIVIERPKVKYIYDFADKPKFDETKKALTKMLMENPLTGAGLSMMGTLLFLDTTADSNVMPVNNFSGKKITDEHKSKISAGAFAGRINQHGGKGGVACQSGCVIRCSNVLNDEKGDMLTTGLEYETAALFGPNCGIYDIEFIAKADRICDDFGVDTIDVADALAVAMDAGELKWGDIDAALALLNEMKEGITPLGIALGHGTAATGKLLKHDIVPVCKNQGLAAYDPRNLQGIGVEYATFTQGADHTGGNVMGMPGLDPTMPEGQVEAVKNSQIGTAVCDNTMCLFAFAGLGTPEGLTGIAQAVEAATGVECDINRLMGIGVQTITMEKEFNKGAGFTPKDDVLPEFFSKIPNASGNVFKVKEEEMQKMWE